MKKENVFQGIIETLLSNFLKKLPYSDVFLVKPHTN